MPTRFVISPSIIQSVTVRSSKRTPNDFSRARHGKRLKCRHQMASKAKDETKRIGANGSCTSNFLSSTRFKCIRMRSHPDGPETELLSILLTYSGNDNTRPALLGNGY